MDIDKSDIRRVLAEHILGLGYGRCWPGHVRSQSSRRSFNASPTSRESSTKRMSKPFRSSDDPTPGG
jgi:hypothetical protein